MLKCGHCKQDNRPDAQFCRNCGAPLKNSLLQTESDQPEGESPLPSPVPGSIEEKILDLLEAGKKIEAIKLYREIKQCDLHSAKEAVEALGKKYGVDVKSGCAGVVLLMVVLGTTAVAGLLCLL